jgi:hypothetical protein
LHAENIIGVLQYLPVDFEPYLLSTENQLEELIMFKCKEPSTVRA